MMKRTLILLLCTPLLLVGCQTEPADRVKAPSGQTAAEVVSTYKDISPAEFAGRMSDEGVTILDVRTPAEVAGGMIEGATHLDFRGPDFEQRLAQLNTDRTFLVYCASGGRSGRTAGLLSEHGAQRVFNLEGGYAAWKASGQ